MNDAYLIGTSCTRFGKQPGASFKDLSREAYHAVLRDAGLANGDQIAATIRAKGAADPRLAAALVTVFIRVSDHAELLRRLTGRGTDPADEIARRVAATEEEIRHAGSYQHVIESGSREADFTALQSIYLAEKARRP